MRSSMKPDFFLPRKSISINKTKQNSKFQSDPSCNCLKNKLLQAIVYFLTCLLINGYLAHSWGLSAYR